MQNKEYNLLIADLTAGLVDESRLEKFKDGALKIFRSDCFFLCNFTNAKNSFELILHSGCKQSSQRRLVSLIQKIGPSPEKDLPGTFVFKNEELAADDKEWGQFCIKAAHAFLQTSKNQHCLFAAFPAKRGMGLLCLCRPIAKGHDFNGQEQELALALSPHLQNFYRLRFIASFWRDKNFRTWFFNTQGLSKREGEIGALIFDGLELAQIAKQLFISEATIREHLKKIYLKMGVHSRTEMFAAYINTCRKTISDSLN